MSIYHLGERERLAICLSFSGHGFLEFALIST
jgi:hypothetical protein